MRNYKEIGLISATIISFLPFCFWLFFVVCFIFALGSNGNPGAIVEAGIDFFKNLPILASTSLVVGILFIYLFDKNS